MWSPKRNADGRRNPFYEFMREVAPGDLVLSFEGTFIRAIAVVQSYCYECPKPAEFGTASGKIIRPDRGFTTILFACRARRGGQR